MGIGRPQGGSRRRAMGIAAAGLAMMIWATAALAAPGDLDTGLSGDGKQTTSITGGVDGGNAVAIQADGKIVVAGGADLGSGFAVARYNPDGTLDTSTDSTPATNFSTDGVATVSTTTGGGLAEAFAVAIQPSDQKIVVAGYGFNDDFSDESEDFALARFNTNGTLDTNADSDPGTHFSTDGAVLTQFAAGPDDFSFNNDRAQAVGVQTDGDIVAAGFGDPTNGADGDESDFAVARYDSNGALDNGFGGDGRVTRNIFTGGDSTDAGHDLALLPGNSVIVVGGAQAVGSSRGWALTKFEPDGDPDLSFDVNGIRTRNFTGLTDDLESVAIQPGGKIVVGGQSGDSFAVARFNTDGSDDPTFSDNGYNPTTWTAGAFDQTWNDIAVQGNGKIVTAGLTNLGVGGDWVVGRFLSDGTVDRDFGSCKGAERTDFGDYDGAEGMAIDSSGRLVAAGYAGSDFAVARFLSGEAVADCVAPNTTIQGPRRTRRRRPVYRLISTDPGSSFRCRINGRGSNKPFIPCSSPFRMPRLPLGPTRLEARAIDQAGNADPTPAFIKIKRIPRRRR